MNTAIAMRNHLLSLALALSGTAHADARHTLRIATAAPDGTAWAQELKVFGREVAAETQGEVLVKWYFSGIAGDELEAAQRLRRDQLDGIGSGGMLCQRLAPVMRVLRVPGVFRNREEVRYVVGRLSSTIETQFRQGGYVFLAAAGLGSDALFSRKPIQSFDDLKREKLWRWDLDDVPSMVEREMGMSISQMQLQAAEAAFASGRVTGVMAVPVAALGFQWFKNASQVVDLRASFLTSCIFVKASRFERLSEAHQSVVRTAAARLSSRLEEVDRDLDRKLLDDIFEKHGIKRIPPERLRADYVAAARSSVERLGDKLVPAALLAQVSSFLVEYRHSH